MGTNRRRNAILLGGLLGGVIVSLLAAAWTLSVFSQALNRQQYAMLFMVTFPVGWLAGAIMRVMKSGDCESANAAAGETGWLFGGMLGSIFLGPVVMLPVSLLLEAMKVK
jgi:uncharacterized membrane protein YkvI